jgi:hypothetical protein
MAVRECVRSAWERGTSSLSMLSGVTVWTLGVAQHQLLSPHVPSHLQFHFFLFSKMKLQLKGCCFNRVEKIQR